MGRLALTVLSLLALGACGKAASHAPAAGAPAIAVKAPVGPGTAVQDGALGHALACAAAGVAQQQALLASAVRAGKTQMVGAMAGPMWAKTVIDITRSHGGSEADAQAAIRKAIDKASQDASAGKPDLDEAGLQACVLEAKL